MRMRVRESFDKDWLFHKGDIPVQTAVKAGMTGGVTDCKKNGQGEWLLIAYADKEKDADEGSIEWQPVTLPHDWVVEGQFVNDPTIGSRPASHGYLPTGIGCYLKSFDIPEEDLGKKITLHFDGVMKKAMVWVNGHLLGTNQSGYSSFYYDLTPMLRYGDEGRNVVFVKADAEEYEGWWYEGAGIYRHVWLQKTGRLHIAHHGVSITTPTVTDTEAETVVRTVIHNEEFSKQACELITRLLNPDGVIVAEERRKVDIERYGHLEVEQRLQVSHPKRWSPEKPNLYTALMELRKDGQILDLLETPFGIRTIEFTADIGFLLNGKPYRIKGTCNHQDFAGVGVALPDRLIEYKIKLLKEMGCNAYRSAHHPPTPELLDICDRLGMLVMDENRKLDSSPEGLAQLKNLVCRDRNHPSVILWCLENEEILEGTPTGARILRELAETVRRLDPSRPVLAAMNHGWTDGEYSEQVDIVGYNYGQRVIGYRGADRPGQYLTDKERYPERLMICSESTSSTTTRGIYEDDPIRGYCSSYETSMPVWACSHEKSWQDLLAYPFLAGIFVWTGFDYRGEPTPHAWPCVTSHFGIMDLCGFPKDAYYYYKSVWTDEPTIHLMPHWNWPGKDGQMIPVRICTNAEQVELILNGRSLGVREAATASYLDWDVPYEKGSLYAAAYSNGRRIAETAIVTSGPRTGLNWCPIGIR
ncbi:glycoside hydrolase family 2 protein [Paenibacillus sp. CC-CFT747]|nr:glycoside hydrolase family 2 protein [Paenibacillus sp. CC-CFT747]